MTDEEKLEKQENPTEVNNQQDEVKTTTEVEEKGRRKQATKGALREQVDNVGNSNKAIFVVFFKEFYDLIKFFIAYFKKKKDNKTLLFFVLGMLCVNSYSQVNPIAKTNIKVNWDKTTHLIFPTEIRYFNSVNDFIVCDSPEAIKNILSIKANAKSFAKSSSLDVATADGKFYSFAVAYTDDLQQTNLFLINDSSIVADKIGINKLNDVHLIFPTEVKYIDFGSDHILAEPADNLQNIVRISVLDTLDVTTNVSVGTIDKYFYTFDFFYDDFQTNYSYVIGDTKYDTPALLKKEDLTDENRADITQRIRQKGRTIYDIGIRKNKVEFAVHNIFVRDNKLIFRLSIINSSNIKYDIDYLKFYIVDKKQNKQTASQIVESTPLFIDNFSSLIEGKSENIFSVCFEKFTIPDNKHFIIEVNEKNGGRHIIYKLDNRNIISAESL